MIEPNNGLNALLSVIDPANVPTDGWLSCGAWRAQRRGSTIVITGPLRPAFDWEEVLETARIMMKSVRKG